MRKIKEEKDKEKIVEEVKKKLEKLGVYGIFVIDDIGSFMCVHNDSEKLRVLEAADLERLYQEHKKERIVEGWLMEEGFATKKDKCEVSYVG